MVEYREVTFDIVKVSTNNGDVGRTRKKRCHDFGVGSSNQEKGRLWLDAENIGA